MISDTILTVGIGTMNPAKIRAVRQITNQVWPQAILKPADVPSGVSEMPMSDDEGMAGALQRARAALDCTHGHYGIGLEGAVHTEMVPTLGQTMFLSNWVAVVDTSGRESIASSGRLPLPECIARELCAGAELGPLMDQITGEQNTKQHLGAAGILTNGLIVRENAFALAVAFALAPFVRSDLYIKDMPDQITH